MTSNTAYSRLEGRFAKLSHLDQASGFLHWDMSAVMPDGGAESRGEQLASLASVSHDLLVAPEVEEWLKAAEQEKLEDWDAANLREMRRDWLHASAVPADLVEKLSRAGSACEMIWRKARPASDFQQVVEPLTKLLDLTRE